MDEPVWHLRAQLDDDDAEIAKQPDGEGEFEGVGLWASGDVLSNTSYLIINKSRALLEVEAKRRLLQQIWTGIEDLAVNIEAVRGDDCGAREFRDDLLQILASVYARPTEADSG